MNETLGVQNRSREVVARFLEETVRKLDWAAARVAWVEADHMRVEPWCLADDAPVELAFLRVAADAQFTLSSTLFQQFLEPTIIAPGELRCSSPIAKPLSDAGVPSLVVLDVAGVLDFDARFVFVPRPNRVITPEACASLGAAAQLIPTVLRQEFERGEARRGSQHDSLTGLLNRRGLKALTEQNTSEGKRAVVFVDVDRFKSINDLHGHAVGDEILADVGTQLAKRIRPADLVARMGGDEFVMVAHDVVDEEAAIIVAQRLVSAVARDHLVSSGDVIAVSVSAGVVMWQPDRDLFDVIRDADELMYQAKRIGGGIAARDQQGRILVVNAAGGVGRELVDTGRAPLEVAPIFDLARDRRWGVHLILRGELCQFEPARIISLVQQRLGAAMPEDPTARHILLEPVGRGWAGGDLLLNTVTQLARDLGVPVTVMVDGHAESAELRLVALEIRARAVAAFALARVGSSAADVRLIAATEPEIVVLDRDLCMNLMNYSHSGSPVRVVSGMAKAVGAFLVLIGPLNDSNTSPNTIDAAQLLAWGGDAVIASESRQQEGVS
jgi:diguanylate cyclase (GGDEF)-like protein